MTASASDLHRLTNVDGIGKVTASDLLEEFDSLEELVDCCRDLPSGFSPVRISRIDGVGPTKARSVAKAIDESGLEGTEEGSA